MAKELFVGVVIGGAVSSAFMAATAGAKTTLRQLGSVADELKNKHSRMGDVMARAFAHPSRNVSTLRREYARLGQTLDQVRIKQERLAARLAAGNALKDARADTWGRMKETGAAAIAVGAPIVKSVRLAAGFQDQMRDIAITGEFNAAQEAGLGQTIRDSALKWNQAQDEIGRGMQVLVAGGIQDAKALEQYAPIMAKGATSTRASMDDLGSVAIALKDNLNIGEAGFEGALNMLAYAGKRGQFEIRDMAKWLPSLSPSFQALGVTGKEAVAEIGAALQIARKGAGSNDEAANNFRNFLQKLTAPETIKDFAKANIDLQESMMELRAKGLTPVDAMLGTITAFLETKGPGAADQFMATMKLKDDKERETALQRLSEAYKLGELFQDMQAMAFIRPAIANMGEMKDIKQGAMGAAGKDLLGEDLKRRMDTASEQFKNFKIGLMDVGLTIGDALLPPLTDLLKAVRPVIVSIGAWAKEYPGLLRGLVGLVAGMLAVKLGVLGIAWGFNFLVASPLNTLKLAFDLVGAKWIRLVSLWQLGRFASISSAFSKVSNVAMMLGRVLAGGLTTGLRIATQALFWLTRAMMANPIGFIVSALAIGAVLVWRNWETVKAAITAGWNWIKGMKDQFFSAGADLINGLVGGVTSKISAARESIVSFGSDIKGWFTSTLGIKSPSRVFMGFGDNIAEGAAIGIQRTSPVASRAAAAMANATANAAHSIKSPSRFITSFSDNIAEGAAIGIQRSGPLASRAAAAMANATATAAQSSGSRGGRATGGMSAAGAGMVIHFSPSITVQGGGDVKGAVMEAAQLSMAELERLIRRLMDQQQRRSN